MITLRSQDGCWKCQHVFRFVGYEEGPYYFCAFDAPQRPPCGSVMMKENWQTSDPEWELAMDKWEKWAEHRERKPWCICDHFLDNPEMEHITVVDRGGYLE
jgi:hypothetical protein